jgi:hypothetical protein
LTIVRFKSNRVRVLKAPIYPIYPIVFIELTLRVHHYSTHSLHGDFCYLVEPSFPIKSKLNTKHALGSNPALDHAGTGDAYRRPERGSG